MLRLVPGFQVGLSWRDHHASVTYHGQSDGLSRRMQVLLDGRVVVGSLFGLVDWDRLGITVDDIERIEVVRGPAGVSFGSNAFVGVINIVTQKPYHNPGWRFSATTGSRDTSLLAARYAHSGDQFDYRASLMASAVSMTSRSLVPAAFRGLFRRRLKLPWIFNWATPRAPGVVAAVVSLWTLSAPRKPASNMAAFA